MTSDEIEDRIKNPAFYGIAKIRVLRDKLNRLPVNKQVGATCGIYALQAALQMQGDKIAPRKQVFGDWRSNPGILRKDSIRGMAKEMGLTKIGEIGGAAHGNRRAGGRNRSCDSADSDSDLHILRMADSATCCRDRNGKIPRCQCGGSRDGQR